jgi:hypothetical protein
VYKEAGVTARLSLATIRIAISFAHRHEKFHATAQPSAKLAAIMAAFFSRGSDPTAGEPTAVKAERSRGGRSGGGSPG